MSGLKYYVIDLETTGLVSSYHEVVEISIIRADDRVQLSRHIKAMYPERASFDALKATGKTLADLEIGISKEQAIEDAHKFLELDGLEPANRCILGHNIIAFDKKFLHDTWASLGLIFPANLYLDTIALTKQFIKTHDLSNIDIQKTATGKISTKLSSALHLTGTKKATSQQHTAQSDTRNTFMLWKKLVDDHKIDYLPYIKTFPHITKTSKALEDIDALDMAEIE